MRVGELARRTGVGVSTLRAWERRFHFLQPDRSASGQRIYVEADVERVNAVLRLVAEGLTLSASIARVASVGTGALPEGEGDALLFSQILDATDQGIWVSRQGRTRYANQRMAELMGYSVEKLRTLPVLDFVDPEDLPLVKERGMLVRAGNGVHYSQVLRRADGSTFLADVNLRPLRTPAGRYEGSVAVINDVTARHDLETQASLRGALLDSIGDAVAASTPDGTLVYINRAAESLFGWRAADVIGKNGVALMLSPGVSDEAQLVHSRLQSGRSYSGNLTMARRDGTTFPARFIHAPVRNEEGEVIAMIAVIHDMSERIGLDDERRTRERQAETLALLGAQALRQREDPTGATAILTEAVEATRRLLGADRAAILDVIDGAGQLQVRASSPLLDEPATAPAGSHSFAGYVALAGRVVVVDNTKLDQRFDPPPATQPDPQTVSAIGAPVLGPQGLLAVLTAESSAPSKFQLSCTHFVQAMANIIGTALMP
jgi:PAS domain S-box-containing protein